MVSKLLTTTVWKTILIICSFILLFGAQIRDLLPPRADTAVDIILVMVFCFFLCDIILRCDSDANYFVCYNCTRWNSGSFLFWCDVVSALTLLYDITFVARQRFGETHIQLYMSSSGNDVSDLGMGRSPVEFDLTFLVLVFQTARVARFIRSSRAIKVSSKIDWYSFVSLCTPSRWKNKKPLDDGRASDLLVGKRWSVVGISMLAAAKASSNARNKNAPWWKRFFRRSTFDTEEFRRHLAATRYERYQSRPFFVTHTTCCTMNSYYYVTESSVLGGPSRERLRHRQTLPVSNWMLAGRHPLLHCDETSPSNPTCYRLRHDLPIIRRHIIYWPKPWKNVAMNRKSEQR